MTAFDRDDALALLRAHALIDEPSDVERVVEDVDIRTLDQGHVIPNMGVVAWRGIWFPRGYERSY